MKHLLFAELKSSWPAWLGVSISFVIINTVLALAALVTVAGVYAVQGGQVELISSSAVTFTPFSNFISCMVVGAVIIGASTSLVVESRRGSLARLALSGATPGQIISTIMLQLVIVTVVCAIFGNIIALSLVQPTLDVLTSDPAEELPRISAPFVIWPALLANLLAVGLALIAGFRQARLASRIAPVEALRQSISKSVERMTVGRWIGASLALTIVVLCYASIPALTEGQGKESFSNVITTAAVLLIASAVFLSQLAPLFVVRLTRAWTSLIPSRSPTWHLALGSTIAKGARLTKLVIPIMMTIGLLLSMIALGETMQASLYASGINILLSGIGITAALVFLAAPLAVVLSGSIGTLIMMSRQRDAELALAGIVGATPAQRRIIPLIESFIMTISGMIPGLLMVVLTVVFMAIGIPKTGFVFAFNPPYLELIIAVSACLIVITAATLLPTLRSLKRPEPEVIARLVAE